MTFALGGVQQAVVRDQLEVLLADAERLAIAVSYVQLSGWELLKPIVKTAPEHVRILCTDQLGITDPKAVRRLMAEGFRVHAYCNSAVYHPKVFVATSAAGEERFILGSANLSRSALITGVEATFGGLDETGSLIGWFDAMFEDPAKSTPFDEARLAGLEASFAARLKSRLAYKRALPVAEVATIEAVADEDAMESAFASLDADPLPLNIDKAGNNVRNLSAVKEVMTQLENLNSKAASEFKLLGLMIDRQLTAQGVLVQQANSIEEIAAIWAAWLKTASSTELLAFNPRGNLLRAREIFTNFWSMPGEVTAYFINHSENPPAADLPRLQTIELLANTQRRWATITLEDIGTLSAILTASDALPPQAQQAVQSYLHRDGKGRRGWKRPDRRIILQAWRDAL